MGTSSSIRRMSGKQVIANADKAVKDSYELIETDTEIFVTEGVNNIMFEK